MATKSLADPLEAGPTPIITGGAERHSVPAGTSAPPL